MAWEKRKRGGPYYYRSRRMGARVIKEYVGCGAAAEQAAQEDAQTREEQNAAVKALREVQEQLDAVTAPLRQMCDDFDVLMKAVLLVAGYHNHRGCWRRRRDYNR